MLSELKVFFSLREMVVVAITLLLLSSHHITTTTIIIHCLHSEDLYFFSGGSLLLLCIMRPARAVSRAYMFRHIGPGGPREMDWEGKKREASRERGNVRVDKKTGDKVAVCGRDRYLHRLRKMIQ